MLLFSLETSSFPYRANFGFENPAGEIHGFPYVAAGTKKFMAYLGAVCQCIQKFPLQRREGKYHQLTWTAALALVSVKVHRKEVTL